MNVEKLAQTIADQIANSVDNPHNVDRYTPSVKMGRRYVGIRVDDRHFLVTIEVEEMEDN